MTAPTHRESSSDSTSNQAAGPAKPEPKRINVAITSEIVRALELVMENEQVTLTEAVRRLLGYGDFVYRAVKQDNAEVLVRQGDNVREIVLL